MELDEQSTEEIGNKADENPIKIEKFEAIIYKLVMNQELDEKEREIIDKIVEKRDEKIYGDSDNNNEDEEDSSEDEES